MSAEEERVETGLAIDDMEATGTCTAYLAGVVVVISGVLAFESHYGMLWPSATRRTEITPPPPPFAC